MKRLARRSGVALDDIVIDSLEEPVTVILILVASRFALSRLTLPADIGKLIDGGLGLAYAVLLAWLLSRLYDAIHQHYLIPIATKSRGVYDDQILSLLRKGIRIII